MASKKTNKMTETQAWKYLAELWKSPKTCKYTGNSEATVSPSEGGFSSYGLCSCVCFMEFEMISHKTRNSMLQAINTTCACGGYKWPLTAAGAKKRVAFCLKMAKRTKRKKHANPRSR